MTMTYRAVLLAWRPARSNVWGPMPTKQAQCLAETVVDDRQDAPGEKSPTAV